MMRNLARSSNLKLLIVLNICWYPSNLALSVPAITENISEFTTFESRRDTTVHASSSTIKPATKNHEAEAVEILMTVLNSTLLRVNKLSNETTTRRGNQLIRKDLDRVTTLVDNVQKFLANQTEKLSQDVSDELIDTLRDIHKFFTESEKTLQEAIRRPNVNETVGEDETTATTTDNPSDNSTETVDTHPQLHSSTEQGRRKIKVVGAGGGGRSFREGRTGLMGDFMRISSRVGQGVQATVRQAGNIFTDSVTQIQNQISQFVDGVGSFIRNAENVLPVPNLFNLTLMPSLPQTIFQ